MESSVKIRKSEMPFVNCDRREELLRQNSGQVGAVWGTVCFVWGYRLFCSVLVNSNILIAYYGVKQSQFIKPISELPR